MSEETEQFRKLPKSESHIFSVSIRGLITLMVLGTVCFMGATLIEVKEPLYSLTFLVAGFYFGQATKNKPTQ